MMEDNKLKFIQKILSFAYLAVTSVRNFLFDYKILKTHKSKLPVICIGNLTVGGSGKSPIAQYFANEFSKSKRVAILLRGYKGKLVGPHLVSAEDRVGDVGDEALMHFFAVSKNTKVVIARSRVVGTRFIEENDLADVVILDDGFQHRYLERDLNILLFDLSSRKTIGDLSKNALLPFGSLRESKTQAFKRADLILGVSRGDVGGETLDVQHLFPKQIPFYSVILKPVNFQNIQTKEILELDSFKLRKTSAITAIAKPESFFANLESLGIRLTRRKSFPDHYYFKMEDLSDLIEPIITTSKDAVKLRGMIKEGSEVFVLNLEVKFSRMTEFLNEFQQRLS